MHSTCPTERSSDNGGSPYWQVCTGATRLQTDPSSLTSLRKRLVEAGVEESLTETNLARSVITKLEFVMGMA